MSLQKSLDLSVIIPFKDKSKMTLEAVLSLFEFGPKIKEVLLVSNNSSAEEVSKVKSAAAEYDNVKVLEYNHPFNYQKINNWAVAHTAGQFILLLNNDTELKEASRGTLEHMYELAKKSDIGMVGCTLLYGDERTIQHAGVYLRPGSLGDHIYIGKLYKKALSRENKNEFPYAIDQDRETSAVTGAVQIVEKKKFDAVKGFDERFIIGGGDVDLCLRLNKAGYKTVLAGKGYILHKESQSRSHLPITFSDFYYSYLSYIEGFDFRVGDPLSPEITKGMTK